MTKLILIICMIIAMICVGQVSGDGPTIIVDPASSVVGKSIGKMNGHIKINGDFPINKGIGIQSEFQRSGPHNRFVGGIRVRF